MRQAGGRRDDRRAPGRAPGARPPAADAAQASVLPQRRPGSVRKMSGRSPRPHATQAASGTRAPSARRLVVSAPGGRGASGPAWGTVYRGRRPTDARTVAATHGDPPEPPSACRPPALPVPRGHTPSCRLTTDAANTCHRKSYQRNGASSPAAMERSGIAVRCRARLCQNSGVCHTLGHSLLWFR
jgi:hypothetical protein